MTNGTPTTYSECNNASALMTLFLTLQGNGYQFTHDQLYEELITLPNVKISFTDGVISGTAGRPTSLLIRGGAL